MKLPYEWQIGWRYTRAGKRTTGNGFISFIALVSMSGIALGVAALIVVLSVMNGFQKEVRDRMLSVLAHVEIFSPTGSMPDWQLTAKEARFNKSVIGAAPYVEAQALLTRADAVSGVALRGVEPTLEPEVSDIGKEMRAGKLTDLVPGDFGIVLGADLATNLGVRQGDKITLVAPEGTMTPAGMLPRLKQFTVVGVFESGHYEYDSTLALINIRDAQALFRLPAPTGVRLRLKDMQRAPEVAHELARSLSGDLYIRDWTQQNKTWFSAVQIRDPAHARCAARLDHEDFRRAGRDDRLRRHGDRRRARLPDRVEHSMARADDRASDRRAVPAAFGVLHQRTAVRTGGERRDPHRRDRVRAVGAGDAVSELARRQGSSGGGAAL